jgi:hypothetical protein
MHQIRTPRPQRAPGEDDGSGPYELPSIDEQDDGLGDRWPGPGDDGRPEGPADPETERRDELARRVGDPGAMPAGRDVPDVLPDVDTPEFPM